MRIISVVALACVLGCATKGPDLSDETIDAWARKDAGQQLIQVAADYEKVDGKVSLRISNIRIVEAPFPALLDDDRFKGVVELLDGEGRVLWSMHYRPSTPENLELRLPAVKGFASVRLSEPGLEPVLAQARTKR